jgi:hypothetical protein
MLFNVFGRKRELENVSNMHVLKCFFFFRKLTTTIVQGWLAVHNVVDVGGVIPVHVYAGSNVPAKVADPYPFSPDPYLEFPKDLDLYPVSGFRF